MFLRVHKRASRDRSVVALCRLTHVHELRLRVDRRGVIEREIKVDDGSKPTGEVEPPSDQLAEGNRTRFKHKDSLIGSRLFVLFVFRRFDSRAKYAQVCLFAMYAQAR